MERALARIVKRHANVPISALDIPRKHWKVLKRIDTSRAALPTVGGVLSLTPERMAQLPHCGARYAERLAELKRDLPAIVAVFIKARELEKARLKELEKARGFRGLVNESELSEPERKALRAAARLLGQERPTAGAVLGIDGPKEAAATGGFGRQSAERLAALQTRILDAWRERPVPRVRVLPPPGLLIYPYVGTLTPAELDEAMCVDLDYAVARLPERMARVLRVRWGLGQPIQTLAVISEDVGVTRERVRQLEEMAADRVRWSLRLPLRSMWTRMRRAVGDSPAAGLPRLASRFVDEAAMKYALTRLCQLRDDVWERKLSTDRPGS